ncbi:class I SAM-dependent methyltransferase [candidate division WWE3 bacterium]|nr:class I SAM-dependent methyltransferase [candidate division WWE3 bacterium]
MTRGDRHLVIPTKLYNFLRELIADFHQIDPYIPARGVLVDVGCGFGQMTYSLATRYPDLHIIGIEPEPDRVLAAKKRYSFPNLEFRVGTAETPGVVPSSDAIIFFDVLHHINPQQQIPVIESYIEHLAPKGVIILKEIDLRPSWKYWFNFLHDYVMTRGDRLLYRSSGEWASILQSRGLSVSIHPHPTWRPYPHVTIVGVKS